MGCVLVGIVFVGYPGTGHILETAFAVKPQGDKLAEHSESVDLLPADLSGKRISFSSGVVFAQRNGLSAGGRLFAGTEGQAVSLFGFVAWASGCFVWFF